MNIEVRLFFVPEVGFLAKAFFSEKSKSSEEEESEDSDEEDTSPSEELLYEIIDKKIALHPYIFKFVKRKVCKKQTWDNFIETMQLMTRLANVGYKPAIELVNRNGYEGSCKLLNLKQSLDGIFKRKDGENFMLIDVNKHKGQILRSTGRWTTSDDSSSSESEDSESEDSESEDSDEDTSSEDSESESEDTDEEDTPPLEKLLEDLNVKVDSSEESESEDEDSDEDTSSLEELLDEDLDVEGKVDSGDTSTYSQENTEEEDDKD